MAMDTAKFATDCINEIKDKVKNLNHLNIIAVGKTGTGKSTLINSVFREKLAETGVGKPVTQHTKCYTKKDVPLSIYDTRGIELGKAAQEETKNEVIEIIRKGLSTGNINDAIHCIWYCINTGSNRIEQAEIDWIREFSEENKTTQVPVIVVLTQAVFEETADELKKTILAENLDVVQIVPVIAEDFVRKNGQVIESYGLDTLIKVMSEALPEELQDTLQNVQIASIEEKKRHANKAVAAATAAAVAAGASPIPLSDCLVLIPIQISMIASISTTFGLDVSKGTIMTFINATIGPAGATVLGKTVVSNFLKLIPGAGTVIGATISGSTAGVLTAALGEIYIVLMVQIAKGELTKGELESKEGEKIIKKLFEERLKKQE